MAENDKVEGLSRVGKLDTLADIRVEMARVYRLAAGRRLNANEMTRFIYALRELRAIIEAITFTDTIERRVAELEVDYATSRGANA